MSHAPLQSHDTPFIANIFHIMYFVAHNFHLKYTYFPLEEAKKNSTQWGVCLQSSNKLDTHEFRIYNVHLQQLASILQRKDKTSM